MKRTTAVGLIVAFFLVLGAVSLAVLTVTEIGGTAPDIPGRGYLDLRLSGPVVETSALDVLVSVGLAARPLTIFDIWMNLRKAKVDDRVQAVLLRLGPLQCDWAKADEIREAVLDFRRSGKKAYALIEEMPDADMEYFVATAADRVVLHPQGWLGANGLGGYVPFLKRALDKIGVKAEFEHVEEYKTAANMFTESGFTAAHREEMEAVYKDLFDQYVAEAARARGLSEERFRSLLDHGVFQGERAKEAGLVDDCLYEDEVLGLLGQGGRPPARIRFDDYVRVKPSSLGLETGRTIALVYAVGTVMTGESFPPVLGASTAAGWLRRARTDPAVKAVVLRVDSPGGSATGSDVIWREVALTAKSKPIVVSMSDVAGSGGYWLATAATRIVAHPQTLTGSIGVLAGKFSFEGLMAKLGVTAEKLAFGSRADAFSPFRSFTPEERRILKEEILWTYARFLEKTAAGRGLAKDDVDAIAKGRIWTGRQAVGLKLVDELGGLTMAIGLAKKEAGIPADEEVRLDVWPKKRTLWQVLFGRSGTGLDLRSLSGRERLVEAVERMERTGVWAIMPFWLRLP